MTETGKIERQSHSYKQGLVLGLTMAEIMLLLVFCLLLAAGSILKHQRDQLNLAKVEISALKGTSPMNEAIAALVKLDPNLANAMGDDGSIPQSKIDEFWTEIVESREIVRQLKSKGLAKSEIGENAQFLSALIEMKQKGESIDTMMTNAELADAIAKFQKANGLETNDLKGTLVKLDELSKQANDAKGKDDKGHKWPPMISLSEAGGYFFRLGSAELSPEFEQRLRDVVAPNLVKMAEEYDVGVIEVVGHTDELPIGIKNSNLDRDMVEVLKGNKPIIALKPGDNAGLGIACSVSVVRNLLQDPRLEGLRILPMSGA